MTDSATQPSRQPLIVPPRMRANEDGDARHATWVESFYDLVFAVAVTGLVGGLRDNPTLAGLGHFTLIFVTIWWAWVGPTVYLTRFDTNDLIHQLSTFLNMLAAAVMITQFSNLLNGQTTLFILAYVFIRVMLLLMYARAALYVKEARHVIQVYLIGFGIGVACWIISLFVPLPYQLLLWIVGLAIDFLTPWVGLAILQTLPVDANHLPERFAQFNLIVLGETIYELVTGSAKNLTGFNTIGVALCLFTSIVLIGGRYFIFTDRNKSDLRQTLGSGQREIYSHLPFVLGLTILGAAAPNAILQADHATLSLATLTLIGLSVLLCTLGGTLIHDAMTRNTSDSAILPRVVTIGSIGLIFVAALIFHFSPLLLLALITIALTVSLTVLSRQI